MILFYIFIGYVLGLATLIFFTSDGYFWSDLVWYSKFVRHWFRQKILRQQPRTIIHRGRK